MERRTENLLQFLGRYAIYGVLPGMWFAYVGGISPWWGALGGALLTAAIALPSWLVARGESPDPTEY